MGSGRTYVIHKKDKELKTLSNEELSIIFPLFGSYKKIELINTNHSRISSAISTLRRSLSKKIEKIYFYTNRKYFIIGAALSIGILSLTIILGDVASLWMVSLWSLTILTNLIFYYLLKAPTVKGRKIMDQVEGFRMYLSVAEKGRFNLLNPPEKTPELFEKYLPYALALDVEQKWAEQFSDVLQKASQGGSEYHPLWYSGHSWNRFSVGEFSSSLGATFSNTISSSATPPGSSSSGGFGGGFSGGGGGGGGGGGW